MLVNELNYKKISKKILTKLSGTLLVGIDTEFINPLNISSHGRKNISVVQLFIDRVYILDVMNCPQVLPLIKKVCESDKLKVGHDLCEDFAQFKVYNINSNNFFDTQVAFRV